jgi:ergothioneine biosynthesis protein EgtB
VLKLMQGARRQDEQLTSVIELGLQHEQQHQELLLTDVKHLFNSNPLQPAYHFGEPQREAAASSLHFLAFDAGVREIGHFGDGFAFDNERPRHREFIEAYLLANRLVTNREFLRFVQDGGYARPELWLADGFRVKNEQGWCAPLYWQGALHERPDTYSLSGLSPLVLEEPVCHVSYYEADAYARWAAARLATEAEWEAAVRNLSLNGNFLESGRLHPSVAAASNGAIHQAFGDTWEWTASSYAAYAGYRPNAGALGEYNGKFMCNQMTLRGGSCVTPRDHIRPTYRNFFPPDARWQFTGIRLARSP